LLSWLIGGRINGFPGAFKFFQIGFPHVTCVAVWAYDSRVTVLLKFPKVFRNFRIFALTCMLHCALLARKFNAKTSKSQTRINER
jgi:hypothetical protein